MLTLKESFTVTTDVPILRYPNCNYIFLLLVMRIPLYPIRHLLTNSCSLLILAVSFLIPYLFNYNMNSEKKINLTTVEGVGSPSVKLKLCNIILRFLFN